MIVTEKEAAGMQCVLDQGTVTGACVGSKCMAWRWADGEIPQRIIRHPDKLATTCDVRPGHVPEGYTFVPNDDDEWAHWIEPIGDRARRGYCGLAGIPAIDIGEG